jgi:hypothetical protein
MLFPWIKIHFWHMLKDLLIAVDQVLYNLQVPRTKSSDLKKEVRPRENKVLQ